MSTLAEILDAHCWLPSQACCQCGWGNGDLSENLNYIAHQIEQVAAAGLAVIELPTVAYKGPHDTDAKFFRQVAERMGDPSRRVDFLSGDNVRDAVRTLLYRAAAASEVLRQKTGARR